MAAPTKSLVVYEIAKGKKISVPIERESVWLTQSQLSDLFNTERSVITKHINKIINSGEIDAKSNVQKMHIPNSDKPVKIYSLDLAISVGYRVNSQRATHFRIWATRVIRDYIIQGYAINKYRLADVGIDELARAVNLIRQTINSNVLTSGEAKGILKVITDYAHSWIMFHKYDEGQIALQAHTKPSYELTYNKAQKLISDLTNTLHSQRVAAKYVGMERDDHGLERIIGSINQTYGGKQLYKSVEEKAAHLLYFVIKDHPLIDGNKRSGSLLFIHYLAENGLLFRDTGERSINDNTIVALALLTSQSPPTDKDTMIRLITNLIR